MEPDQDFDDDDDSDELAMDLDSFEEKEKRKEKKMKFRFKNLVKTKISNGQISTKKKKNQKKEKATVLHFPKECCYNVLTKKMQIYYKVYGTWWSYVEIINKQLISAKVKLSWNYTLDCIISTRSEMKYFRHMLFDFSEYFSFLALC